MIQATIPASVENRDCANLVTFGRLYFPRAGANRPRDAAYFQWRARFSLARLLGNSVSVRLVVSRLQPANGGLSIIAGHSLCGGTRSDGANYESHSVIGSGESTRHRKVGDSQPTQNEPEVGKMRNEAKFGEYQVL
jgi:hypothetical protein